MPMNYDHIHFNCDKCWWEESIFETQEEGVEEFRREGWAVSERDNHLLCPKCIEKISHHLTQHVEFRDVGIEKIINLYNETIEKPDHELTSSAFIMKNTLKKIIQKKIPPTLKPIISQLRSIIREFTQERIGVPEFDYSPENPDDWWITIPVYWSGTVEEGHNVYSSIVEKFCDALPAPGWERIHLDFRMTEGEAI